MAATQFSDDAYNKRIGGAGVGAGTLIGNWSEERELRDACGEGRSVPQRHLPRSGLLTDWTKVPSGGPRKQDNTFERIYGPKALVNHVPQSAAYGSHEQDVFGDTPLPATLQAEGRIPRMGDKETMARMGYHDAAEGEMQAEEDIRDAESKARSFATTSGATFVKHDESLVEYPEHTRTSFKQELLHGAPTDQTRHLSNQGLEHPDHTHYSNSEAITHQRMAMSDDRLRSDVKASAATGPNAFGKNSEFSKPIGESMLGLCKDDEVDGMYQSLKGTQPLRTHGGAQPRGPSFSGVPSLMALKVSIHEKIAMTWGAPGYVILRQRLFNMSDEEGFIHRKNATAVFREELGVSAGEVSDRALEVYLKQLITMRKDELHVGTLMVSLRPDLPLLSKKGVVEAFGQLSGGAGAFPLGMWLGRLHDAAAQEALIAAFGGQSLEAVGGTQVTEAVFLELCSDLAPLVDLGTLLTA